MRATASAINTSRRSTQHAMKNKRRRQRGVKSASRQTSPRSDDNEAIQRDDTASRFFEPINEGTAHKENNYTRRSMSPTQAEVDALSDDRLSTPPYIVHPAHPKKMAWDMFIGSLIMYSVVIVPYRICFWQTPSHTAYVTDWLIDGCFLLDMGLSFRVAFTDAVTSELVVDANAIRSHYLRTWFTIDFLSTVPIDQLVAAFMGSTSGSKARLLKLIRILRLFRLIKLVRLMSKKQKPSMSMESSSFEINPAFGKVGRLLFIICFLAHLFACGFHFIAYDSATPRGWLKYDMCLGEDAETCVYDSGLAYMLSLYWTVATMTAVGYGDVSAASNAERAYSIVTQVVGAAMFGFIIGDISSIMETMDMRTALRRDKMAEVKAYLTDRKLPVQLQQRVKHYYRYFLARTSIIHEESILEEVSSNLRTQVVRESHALAIKKISLLDSADPGFVNALFSKLKPTFQLPQDTIATQGNIAKEMFFLLVGKVEEFVTVNAHSSSESPMPLGDVVSSCQSSDPHRDIILCEHKPGSHFAEVGVLLAHLHTTSFRSLEFCDLFVLSKEALYDILFHWKEEKQRMVGLATMRAKVVKNASVAQERFNVKDPGVLYLEMELPRCLYVPGGRSRETILVGSFKQYNDVQRRKIAAARKASLNAALSPAKQERRLSGNSIAPTPVQEGSVEGEGCAAKPELPFLMFMPDTPLRSQWDLALGLCIIYSVLIVPVRIGFGVTPGVEGTAIDVIVDVFFGLDMVLNFRTAFTDERGMLVTDCAQISRRYFRGWFIIDFLSTFPFDHVGNAIANAGSSSSSSSSGDGGGSAELRSLKIIRVLRLLRLFKILRLAKLQRIVTILEDDYDVSPAVVRLGRLAIQMTFMAHCMACFWYYQHVATERKTDCSTLGSARLLARNSSWVEVYTCDPAADYNDSLGSAYLAALYWAFTTISTTGYGDIIPRSKGEIMYAVFAMLLGALIFGYVVGSMASLVGKLSLSKSQHRDKMLHVRQYMIERKLSVETQKKMRHFYFHYLERKSAFDESAILSDLSASLRQEVIMCLHADVITKIGIFEDKDIGFISYVVSLMRPEFCVPNDFVFREGDVGKEMYFLVKGFLEVVVNVDTPEEKKYATLKEGDYFGEIAVFQLVRRTATIRAKTFSTTFVLTRENLEVISYYYPNLADDIRTKVNKDFQSATPDDRESDSDDSPDIGARDAKRPLKMSKSALRRENSENLRKSWHLSHGHEGLPPVSDGSNSERTGSGSVIRMMELFDGDKKQKLPSSLSPMRAKQPTRPAAQNAGSKHNEQAAQAVAQNSAGAEDSAGSKRAVEEVPVPEEGQRQQQQQMLAGTNSQAIQQRIPRADV